jgi:hypothetical protein
MFLRFSSSNGCVRGFDADRHMPVAPVIASSFLHPLGLLRASQRKLNTSGTTRRDHLGRLRAGHAWSCWLSLALTSIQGQVGRFEKITLKLTRQLHARAGCRHGH